MAVDRPFAKDGEQSADFLPITVWRKPAEACAGYLTKGSMVAVSGRIQTSSYDNSEGNKVYKTEIVADRVEFLSTKKTDPLATAKETFKGAEERDMTETDQEIPF